MRELEESVKESSVRGASSRGRHKGAENSAQVWEFELWRTEKRIGFDSTGLKRTMEGI